MKSKNINQILILFFLILVFSFWAEDSAIAKIDQERVKDIAEEIATDILDWTQGISFSENFAFLADDEYGLQIIDISDLDSPFIVSSIDTPGNAQDLLILNQYLFIADGEKGLQIVDISNPTSPILINNIDTPGYASRLATSGNYLFIADGKNGLQVVDISTPTFPIIIGSVDTPGEAIGICVSGNYVYIADYRSGLQVIDISSPNSPVIVGDIDTPGQARGVITSGNFAFIADGEEGLQIIDISNPNSPILVNNLSLPGRANNLTIDGDFLFIAVWGYGLQIINISNPSYPSRVSLYRYHIRRRRPARRVPKLVTPISTIDLSVYKNYLFIYNRENGLQIIDISRPTRPLVIANMITPSSAQGILIAKTYTFIAGNLGFLDRMDAPTFIKRITRIISLKNEIIFATVIIFLGIGVVAFLLVKRFFKKKALKTKKNYITKN